MKITRIEGDLKGWLWDPKEKCLVNPAIGRIQMVSVVDDNGVERYQQPVWLEQRGEIDVIVDERGCIAFVETVRHAVLRPFSELEWKKWKPTKENPGALIPHPVDLAPGVTQLEIPRGFTEAVLREAEEEVQRKVYFAAQLGNLNMNTAFMGTSPFVYLCYATPRQSDIPPDPNETIKKVVWLTPEETRNVETLCATTCAALYLFRRWALQHPEDRFNVFLKNVGAQL